MNGAGELLGRSVAGHGWFEVVFGNLWLFPFSFRYYVDDLLLYLRDLLNGEPAPEKITAVAKILSSRGRRSRGAALIRCGMDIVLGEQCSVPVVRSPLKNLFLVVNERQRAIAGQLPQRLVVGLGEVKLPRVWRNGRENADSVAFEDRSIAFAMSVRNASTVRFALASLVPSMRTTTCG
jgi:hypothetical protein